MPGGSDPSTRVGRCAGYKCSCQAYRQVKGDKMWPVCECNHVQQSHANPDPEPLPPVNPETADYHQQTSQSPSTDELLGRIKGS